jgi:hypothetical protein
LRELVDNSDRSINNNYSQLNAKVIANKVTTQIKLNLGKEKAIALSIPDAKSIGDRRRSPKIGSGYLKTVDELSDF